MEAKKRVTGKCEIWETVTGRKVEGVLIRKNPSSSTGIVRTRKGALYTVKLRGKVCNGGGTF